jgi:hypothetical protein
MSLLALLTCGALAAVTVFPPWATVMGGNGYPRVTYAWLRSPPPPIGGFGYYVDIVRLEERYGIVLLLFAFAASLVWAFARTKSKVAP